jgi:hypothetical protein
VPEHKHVRGYLICEYLDLGFWVVRPHSLVEFEDGTLVDIGPRPPVPWQYPFVRHVGTEEEFAQMAPAMQIKVMA